MDSRLLPLVPVPDPSPQDLTPKERLVHELLVFEGLTDGEMAERLGMTERAVKFHVQNLLQKTRAPDRFKMAVAFWRAWSGYDRRVADAPRPVRLRDDPKSTSRKRGAAKKASGRKTKKSSKTARKQKSVAKKKAVAKTAATKKKKTSRGTAAKSTGARRGSAAKAAARPAPKRRARR